MSRESYLREIEEDFGPISARGEAFRDTPSHLPQAAYETLRDIVRLHLGQSGDLLIGMLTTGKTLNEVANEQGKPQDDAVAEFDRVISILRARAGRPSKEYR